MNNQTEIQALKEEIQKLSEIVSKMKEENAKDIKKSIEEYIPKDLINEIKSLKEKLTEKIPVEKIDELKEKIGEKLPVIKEGGEQIVENVSEFTRKNPFISLGIALGVGVLIGKVLKK